MANINNKMTSLGKEPSIIRNIFEYGNKRAAEIGRENVFDFSLGNPSVPAPDIVDNTILNLVNNTSSVSLHGYTSAPGDNVVREAIASDIRQRFNADVDKDGIYITCGAAASLTITLNALCVKGDEVIAFAPFFPEYRVFVESSDAEFRIVPADTEKFLINFNALESAINPKTKAVIINTPNNPTGVVLPPECINRLTSLLLEKSNQYGHPIYLISDEPYRELVYDDKIKVPYIINEYDNTVVCYSFSKSLSLPGERIGYIAIGNRMAEKTEVYAAVCGAARSLGFVCAPSMMQYVISNCLGKTSDISAYRENRDLLYNSLTEYGFDCVHPDGAFYLFVKSPEDDAAAFCEKAKKYELLLVPSDSFGCPGYVRVSYCVSNDMIIRALPSFKKLAEEYK